MGIYIFIQFPFATKAIRLLLIWHRIWRQNKRTTGIPISVRRGISRNIRCKSTVGHDAGLCHDVKPFCTRWKARFFHRQLFLGIFPETVESLLMNGCHWRKPSVWPCLRPSQVPWTKTLKGSCRQPPCQTNVVLPNTHHQNTCHQQREVLLVALNLFVETIILHVGDTKKRTSCNGCATDIASTNEHQTDSERTRQRFEGTWPQKQTNL